MVPLRPSSGLTALSQPQLGCWITDLFLAAVELEKEMGRPRVGQTAEQKPLHCTALHCTALHCIVLHCIALQNYHCTAMSVPVEVTGPHLDFIQQFHPCHGN